MLFRIYQKFITIVLSFTRNKLKIDKSGQGLFVAGMGDVLQPYCVMQIITGITESGEYF